MPELPDVVIYLESLREYLGGRVVNSISVRSPFLLRTFEPPIESFEGGEIEGFERLGKQIAWRFKSGAFLLFHLMIAGRFHWRKPDSRPNRKNDLAAFAFDNGVMMLTEASKKQRASLHALANRAALEQHRQSGLEVLDCDYPSFREALVRQNRTLKRGLTDPRLLSGIGNAYSDEILHAAKLSPVLRTQQLSEQQLQQLFDVVQSTLAEWIERLRAERGSKFPEKVTAFRPQMAVHGRFGEPCPVCQTAVQRIVYSENETNYCPTCQTNGRLLADRSLSRLLKDDWPKRIEPGG